MTQIYFYSLSLVALMGSCESGISAFSSGAAWEDAWQVVMEGYAVDARGNSTVSTSAPAQFQINAVGQDKCEIRLQGDLDFYVFDPTWNLVTDVVPFDLSVMDGQTGDLLQTTGAPFGVFYFWGGQSHWSLRDGWTWFSFELVLTPLDGPVLAATEADFDWYAVYQTTGSLYAPPKCAELLGTRTVALRSINP